MNEMAYIADKIGGRLGFAVIDEAKCEHALQAFVAFILIGHHSHYALQNHFERAGTFFYGDELGFHSGVFTFEETKIMMSK
ncbi:MAG: hypothetical protein QNJ02_01960 [Desulfobacterales bacterium]|nr:hypothetical protein [Desulfobacterales bacterium]MDJ0874002.1 hypothetical protein [Desulfobacterales bacterium]